MEIERINENTIKFYVSYADIEDRGFEREEIWYDRERSEQLFWQMMEEVNGKEDFTIEGPLWIQVQALEKGLEVVVTRSQLSASDDFKVMNEDKKGINLPMDERIEKLLESKFGKSEETTADKESEELENDSPLLFMFEDFEDVIQLSHYFQHGMEESNDSLYSYEGKYYLHVEFTEEALEDVQENHISQILEFSNQTNISIHILTEYGKEIFGAQALSQIREFFPVES